METHQDPRLGIGGNLPPTDAEILKSTLEESNKDILDMAQALIEAADRAPATIEEWELFRQVKLLQEPEKLFQIHMLKQNPILKNTIISKGNV